MMTSDVGSVVSSAVRSSVNDPEIKELQFSFDDYEIGRFQIGMNDLMFMNDMNCFEYLQVRTIVVLNNSVNGARKKGNHETHMLPITSYPNHVHVLRLLL
jgi:hypothetical protein